MYFADLLQTN